MCEPDRPRIDKYARVTGAQRAQLATWLETRYQEGTSIRQLTKEAGRSYGFVHKMLRESGVVMRGPGCSASISISGLRVTFAMIDVLKALAEAKRPLRTAGVIDRTLRDRKSVYENLVRAPTEAGLRKLQSTTGQSFCGDWWNRAGTS